MLYSNTTADGATDTTEECLMRHSRTVSIFIDGDERCDLLDTEIGGLIV